MNVLSQKINILNWKGGDSLKPSNPLFICKYVLHHLKIYRSIETYIESVGHGLKIYRCCRDSFGVRHEPVGETASRKVGFQL